ncbi:hypothetical protein COTS27_00984 [Spirochaetota bacterium]|nr:hypothetical protein COTS27_00984 [Spirochaetota bacterium]
MKLEKNLMNSKKEQTSSTSTKSIKFPPHMLTRRAFLVNFMHMLGLGLIIKPSLLHARAKAPTLKSKRRNHSHKSNIIIRVLIYQGTAIPKSFPIAVVKEGIRYRDKLFPPINSSYGRTVEVTIDKEAPIVYKKNAYEGKFIVVKKKNQYIIVNELELDKYLTGVVKKEISPSWHHNAIRTQAIAARSYAYNYINTDSKALYHVGATVAHQVFGGTANVPASIEKGVSATQDIILIDKFDKQPVQSFFHACCGGITEKAENVWSSEKSLRYFKNIRCPHCKTHPLYRWERKFSTQYIHNALKKLKIDSVKAIRVGARTGSKRIHKIFIKAQHGKHNVTHNLTGNKFRVAISPRDIPSTLFSIKQSRKDYNLTGKGFGHGVGLCQWGTKTMAEKGFSAFAILDFYYKNCKTITIAKYTKKYGRKHSKKSLG